jgi:LPS-assembly protein
LIKAKKKFFLFVLLFISSFFDSALFAENNDVLIEADNLENFIDKKLKATGNAILKKNSQTIRAEIIEYDQISEDLYARGNVSLETKSSNVIGTELEYSLSTETGSIPNASFSTILTSDDDKKVSNFNNTLRGNASLLLIEGENKKSAKNISVTTCEANQDDWFIKAEEAEINQKSQRLIVNNAKLEFFGVPVLYTPYANFSFNSDRKSGFLVPSLGSTSRSGFEISTPYYFNLSPDSDLTLTPRYFGKRGPQLAGEYRYIDKKYEGISSIEYMPKDEAISERDDRYLFKISHDHDLGNGFSANIRYENVSDDNYFSDMKTLVSQTSRVSLPQELKISYHSDYINTILLAQKFENLTGSSPYERLPSFQFNYDNSEDYFKQIEENIDKNIFEDYFIEQNLAFEITQFERNNDYKSVSPHGTRITSRPTLGLSYETSYGFIRPAIIADIKHYDLNGSSSVSSKTLFIPTFSLNSGIFFDRYFKINKNDYFQSFEPSIFYSYTPFKDQSMLPMFDTALTDLNRNSIFYANQFVGGDRVMDSHQITLSASSKTIDNKGLEKLNITLAQRFYFDEREVLKESQFSNSDYQSDSSDLFILLGSSISKSLRLEAEHQYNLDEETTNRLAFSAKYKPDLGKMLEASYRFINDPNSGEDIKQANISGQWPLGSGFSSVGRYQYDIQNHGVIESLAGISYDAGCWTTSLLFHRFSLATTEKPNYTFFFMLELGSLGTIESGGDGAFEEALYRNVPGAYLSRDLPDNYRKKYLN